MKKTLLIALICFTNLFSHAQSTTWCPPGAKWHYAYGDVGQKGYLELTYDSDTVIMGIACHVLTEHLKILEMWTGTIYNIYTPRYTFDSNGVVYSLYINGTYDTLFDFNAHPGQTWHMPQVTDSDYVQVEDTGHNIIQGYNLKWFTISYHGLQALGGIDTIYERMGCIGFTYPFEVTCAGCDPLKGIFCNYSDSAFGIWDTTDAYCTDLSTGFAEPIVMSDAAIFPNPITTIMNVVINNPKDCEISLYDVTGRIVLQERLSKTTSINTEQLARGIYLYEVRNKNGVIKKGKVVKE